MTSSTSRLQRRFRSAFILLFIVAVIGFTVWIIHEANIGRDNALFKLVRRTPYGDKLGHFFLAGLFTLAANFLLQRWSFPVKRLRVPIGTVVVSILVLLEEGSQYFLPTRSLDAMDAVANFAGIFAFSIPHFLKAQRRQQQISPR